MINKNDSLRIYRGQDIVITKGIVIKQPTLNDITDYGESEYWSMVQTMTSTPQNLKWQLHEAHIDYTTLTPWQLFYQLIYNLFSKEETKIIFGDLDFQKFNVRVLNKQEIIEQQSELDNIDDIKEKEKIEKIKPIVELYQIVDDSEIILDEELYEYIMDIIRQANFLIKDTKIPANNYTKKILIEDAKEDYLIAQNKKSESLLKNMVSAMVNTEGFKYSHKQVWEMPINAFMDSVQRIQKIQNSKLLLTSGYSGFGINLQEVDKKQIDWLGELS